MSVIAIAGTPTVATPVKAPGAGAGVGGGRAAKAFGSLSAVSAAWNHTFKQNWVLVFIGAVGQDLATKASTKGPPPSLYPCPSREGLTNAPIVTSNGRNCKSVQAFVGLRYPHHLPFPRNMNRIYGV